MIQRSTLPEVGEKMPDGTIYAGIDRVTGKTLYAMPQDEGYSPSWEEAMKAASTKQACGHADWRVPTDSELHTLFTNKNRGALKGTFNTKGAVGTLWYWSSTQYMTPDMVTTQNISNGMPGSGLKTDGWATSSVRLVRSGPFAIV